MSLVSTLLALPILVAVSIPLVLSAWVTASLALITLTLRLTVVYIELSYALLLNFFTLPMTTSSLLNFAASEPASPVVGRSRRNSRHGLAQPSKNKDSLTAWALNGIHDDLAKRQKKIYARSMVQVHHLSTISHLGLPISGDEWRDFEGVGGWRPSHDSSRSKLGGFPPTTETILGSAPFSSMQIPTGDINLDAEMDADERAWLSINHRLELPSRVVALGTNSTTTQNEASPVFSSPSNSRDGLHSSTLMSTSKSRHNSDSGRRRHHQRSHTTSSLATSDFSEGNGLYLSLSKRPDHARHAMSPSTSGMNPFMTPQPYSQLHIQSKPYKRTQTNNQSPLNDLGPDFVEGFGSRLVGSSTGGSPTNGNGGYFALERPRMTDIPDSSMVDSSHSSAQTTPISIGGRDASSLQLARSMAHYPTGLRYRRRSISGPHSRSRIIGNVQGGPKS